MRIELYRLGVCIVLSKQSVLTIELWRNPMIIWDDCAETGWKLSLTGFERW